MLMEQFLIDLDPQVPKPLNLDPYRGLQHQNRTDLLVIQGPFGLTVFAKVALRQNVTLSAAATALGLDELLCF
jgi:hypothetical protein